MAPSIGLKKPFLPHWSEYIIQTWSEYIIQTCLYMYATPLPQKSPHAFCMNKRKIFVIECILFSYLHLFLIISATPFGAAKQSCYFCTDRSEQL